MTVQFGLAIKNFVGPEETPDVDEILRYSERAEALGFESLWAWDHVLLGVKPAFPILDSLSILTAIAMRTSRVKLGILGFDEQTKVVRLEGLNPGASVKKVTENTGFDLLIPDKIPVTKPPQEAELDLLRSLDPERNFL